MKDLINKYAELTVRVGVNVQKDQLVVIRSSTDTKDFVRALVEQAYLAGAKKVYVEWSDSYVSNITYKHAKVETLEDVEQFVIDKAKYLVENNACYISVTSPVPGLNKGLDSSKLRRATIANQKATLFFQQHLMANKTQWVVVGAPNKVWAKKVFKSLNEKDAYIKLWEAILNTARVKKDIDVLKEWDKHNQKLSKTNDILNKYNFKELNFTNSLGTDLKVGLVKNHVWAGGNETTENGITFNPNIPTEESFTMPYKYGTNGIVYSTKPLNYQGKLIDDFFLEFKDGKVINFGAKKEEEALKELLNTDDGSKYIGEIALISHDSPISNTNILFYNTLYDENASCHMALGKAYAMNLKDGTKMSNEELVKHGANDSLIHVDFMFGSKDLNIKGLTYDNKEVLIFKEGNFII